MIKLHERKRKNIPDQNMQKQFYQTFDIFTKNK